MGITKIAKLKFFLLKAWMDDSVVTNLPEKEFPGRREHYIIREKDFPWV